MELDINPLKDNRNKYIIIIEIFLLLSLAVYFTYARVEGYYSSVYISIEQCGNHVSSFKISKAKYETNSKLLLLPNNQTLYNQTYELIDVKEGD